MAHIQSEQPTNATTPVIVHHLSDSRSQRILWLLEELEVPYEIKRYERQDNHMAPRELRAVHPLGKSPVITAGSITVAESGAIVAYLIEKHGKPVQLSEEGRRQDTYFSHYAEGSLLPILVQKLMYTIIPSQTPFYLRPLAWLFCGGLLSSVVNPQLKTHSQYIESHIASMHGGWFAGGAEPTSADYMMAFGLEAMVAFDTDKTIVGPASRKYVEKVHARPAYKRALERGGEYAYA
ncbi:thioredoxin-like protein [Pterulicium gracile]|uniref:glutathione transferase n=1 Tax=Pterulicium gracile TaxID=1884261 RepID=A0A5C3QQU7_9AGAR|nr:thioredoxin-like protein [Pterula gracilis]